MTYRHSTIEPDPLTYNLRHLSGKQGERLRVVLEKIAGSVSDDYCNNDEQPQSVMFDLNDVRLVRQLLQ